MCQQTLLIVSAKPHSLNLFVFSPWQKKHGTYVVWCHREKRDFESYFLAGLPDFFGPNIPKRKKYTKLPQTTYIKRPYTYFTKRL
jgi:hypothetical protein